jgi:arylsulfatase A-like enzyme/Tfp pilus assembly protein PilF
MHLGSRRAAILGFCTLTLLTLAACKSSPKKEASSAAPQPASVQPARIEPVNLVVITIDTLRPDHLHCYGNKNIQTPVIDSLAENGVLFEKAVTQVPLTQPSHASIFTGTNPNVHNVRNTGGFTLLPSSVTLATILQKQGWDTAAFVGATVLKKSFGFNQGFSVYDDQMPRSDKTRGFSRVASRPASIVVDHALGWLNTQSKQPFFVWLHFYDPHEPYNPPEKFRRQYPGNPYDAEIAYTDQQVGRFLDAIKKKSPAGKTLIVLLADHGESLGDHGEYNHGVFLYDSTLRIPLIMVGPGVPSGIRIQQQAREIDVLPTILNLMGGKASSAVQGTNMVPAFSEKPVPTTYSCEETLFPKINMGWAELRGIHTAHWMYIRAPKPELYDLDQDPSELHNVIDAHPKEYRELEQELKTLSQVGNNGSETVVTNQMDSQTMEQLRSLGYVGGTSEHNIELNGKGADPKDRIGILKIIQMAIGPDADKLSPSRKIDLLRSGLAQDPTNPDLYYDLGQIYMDSGQYDPAMQVYLAALHHGIRDEMLLSRLGDLYLRGGDRKQAIYYFEQTAQVNPLDAQTQSNLGTAYLQSGRFADAERAFRRALVGQEYAPAYNGLAILGMHRHDLSSARKNYERAIHLNPNYAEAQFNLGLLCKQSGDLDCARKAFRAFLADAPPAYKNVIPQAKAELISMQ